MNKLLTNAEAPAKEKHVRSECNEPVCQWSCCSCGLPSDVLIWDVCPVPVLCPNTSHLWAVLWLKHWLTGPNVWNVSSRIVAGNVMYRTGRNFLTEMHLKEKLQEIRYLINRIGNKLSFQEILIAKAISSLPAHFLPTPRPLPRLHRHPNSHVAGEGLSLLLEGAAALPSRAQPHHLLEGLLHRSQDLP